MNFGWPREPRVAAWLYSRQSIKRSRASRYMIIQLYNLYILFTYYITGWFSESSSKSCFCNITYLMLSFAEWFNLVCSGFFLPNKDTFILTMGSSDKRNNNYSKSFLLFTQYGTSNFLHTMLDATRWILINLYIIHLYHKYKSHVYVSVSSYLHHCHPSLLDKGDAGFRCSAV